MEDSKVIRINKFDDFFDWSTEPLVHQIVAACIEVNKVMGIGLLEKAYKLALAHELKLRGFSVEIEKPIDIKYKSLTVNDAFFADMVVNGTVIIELKAIESLTKANNAQLRNYMLLSGIPFGLLVNFHEPNILDGGLYRKALARH